MKKYNVKITTPGHIIVFRGKRARTPIVFENVLESEIQLLELQARRLMLDIEVIDFTGNKRLSNMVKKKTKNKPKDKLVKKKEKGERPSNILDQLIYDDE
jgi:hypothetical protein